MTVREALTFFSSSPKVLRRLQVLDEIGLGYLRLGQPATTLSGGEAQRIKIAAHLSSHTGDRMLYILDEPTTGLHFDDIAKLLAACRKLIQAGHSLLVIEHNLDVIKTADWIIDLGPEGGEEGGQADRHGHAGADRADRGVAHRPLSARCARGRPRERVRRRPALIADCSGQNRRYIEAFVSSVISVAGLIAAHGCSCVHFGQHSRFSRAKTFVRDDNTEAPLRRASMSRLVRLMVFVPALLTTAAVTVFAQDPARFEDVVRNLRNPDSKIRISAVRLLRETGYAEAMVPLAGVINDQVDEIQLEAIDAELSFYLVDPVPAKKRVALVVEVRSSGRAPAAFELGPLGVWPKPVPNELVDALLQAVDDENKNVRVEAIIRSVSSDPGRSSSSQRRQSASS